MDPTYISIVVGITSSLITGAIMAAINFAALRAWMARREEREEVLREDVKDHEARLRLLERDLPPFDYPARR